MIIGRVEDGFAVDIEQASVEVDVGSCDGGGDSPCACVGAGIDEVIDGKILAVAQSVERHRGVHVFGVHAPAMGRVEDDRKLGCTSAGHADRVDLRGFAKACGCAGEFRHGRVRIVVSESVPESVPESQSAKMRVKIGQNR